MTFGARSFDGIRAVIFDLDDTLICTTAADDYAFGEVLQLLSTQFSVQEDCARHVLMSYRTELKRAPWDQSNREHPWTWRRRIWRSVLAKNCHQLDAANIELASYRANELFRDARLSKLKIPPACNSTLRKLKERGLQLGIITNGNTVIQREKLAACGAYTVFKPEHICVGGEELLAGRHHKPDSRIFQLMCGYLGCSPTECMFVGDNWSVDVCGAHSAKVGVVVCISAQEENTDKASLIYRSTRQFTKIEEFCETIDAALCTRPMRAGARLV